MGNAFSVPIFFIVFRETLEAGIIVAVLLGLVEGLVAKTAASSSTTLVDGTVVETDENKAVVTRSSKLIRRMRLQIWGGVAAGLLIALCIGAAFIAVFFTTLRDIWGQAEEIWEGTFSLIASIIIFVMGVTMLRIDRSKVKWRRKLQMAFDKDLSVGSEGAIERREGRTGKWTLFLLPFVTVVREGLEAVVFVGGVSLGQSARSIPLAAIIGIIVGVICGYLIWLSGSRVNLSIFLVVSTNILLLIGAGLFSKSVAAFERYKYNIGTGGDAAENGDGPGSYDVTEAIGHLTYGNPENYLDSKGWGVFNAILGWSNNFSYGSVLSYIFYWLAVIGVLIFMKWQEGRIGIFGRRSAAGQRRLERRNRRVESAEGELKKSETPESGSEMNAHQAVKA